MKNKPTNLEIIEKEMQEELKPILVEFNKKKEEINGEIVSSNYELQERIEEMENSNISFTVDTNGDSKSNPTMSSEMQKFLKDAMMKRVKEEQEKKEEELNKQREEAEKETKEKCKNVVDKARGKLEEKVNTEKENLEKLIDSIKASKAELEDIKKAMSGLGPKSESRIFTLLDSEKGTIINKRQEMNKEKREISKNIEVAQLELNDFNSKYGTLDFENENIITDLLKTIYGEKADYSYFLGAEEWDWENEVEKQKEANKQKILDEQRRKSEEIRRQREEQKKSKEAEKEKEGEQNPTKDTEKEEGQNPAKDTEKKEGQKPAKGTEKEEGQKSPKDTEKKEGQKPAKEAEGEGKQKKASPNEQSTPRMKYIAEKDTYIIEGKPNRYVAVKRSDYKNTIDKSHIAEIMRVSEEQLDYVDMGAVAAWLGYDGKYKTNEAFKYLKSILNPEMSEEKTKNIEYDLSRINKNKNLSKAERRNMMECINFAKEFQIADVKKGFGMIFREKISSMINKLNRNKIGGKKKSGAEILAENMKNEKRQKKDKKFKKEIAVTSTYNKISKEISGASKDEISSILEKAKQDLKSGKISTTEYSGLIYNANNRLRNPAPKQPVPSRGSNGTKDR